MATAQPLTDAREARELRQSGIPVHDGTAAELETVLAVGKFTVAICTSWQIAELYLPAIRRLRRRRRSSSMRRASSSLATRSGSSDASATARAFRGSVRSTAPR